MATIGYTRISTLDQSADLQRDAMKTASCDRVFEDLGVSGSKRDRPGLNAALDFLREGDTLVVWKLDRLGRRTIDVLAFLEELTARGVSFRSVTESLDSSTPVGKMILLLLAGFAEMERSVLIERTHAGLKAARDRGRLGGRPRSLNPSVVAVARKLYADGRPAREIAAELGCSVATIYRALAG